MSENSFFQRTYTYFEENGHENAWNGKEKKVLRKPSSPMQPVGETHHLHVLLKVTNDVNWKNIIFSIDKTQRKYSCFSETILMAELYEKQRLKKVLFKLFSTTMLMAVNFETFNNDYILIVGFGIAVSYNIDCLLTVWQLVV